jgi:hypothetical protein
MAATKARKTPLRGPGRQPVLGYVQKAGTKILKGTMAMHVAGVFQPADSGVSGAVYAGISEKTYDASSELTDKTWTEPMVFHRTAGAFNGKSGDLPTAADLGSLIAVEDDDTVKHTTASDDVEVRLLAIEGNQYVIEPA